MTGWSEILGSAIEEMGTPVREAVLRQAARLGVSPQTLIRRAIRLGLARIDTQERWLQRRRQKKAVDGRVA